MGYNISTRYMREGDEEFATCEDKAHANAVRGCHERMAHRPGGVQTSTCICNFIEVPWVTSQHAPLLTTVVKDRSLAKR